MNKKILSALLSAALLVSTVAFSFTANAATVDDDAAGYNRKSSVSSPDDFSWDNANVYFLLTDRFYNGDTSNDHAYGRALDASGRPLSGWNTAPGTFHGGDFKGIAKKIEEGYFDKLGTNAIWLSAPYEQIHGYVTPGEPNDFAHYSYHGYYVLDYTEPDLNFGTKQDFQNLVDTAHKHNIRIIMDIVMNHAGYNTIKDMMEFNFGSFKNESAAKSYLYKLTGVNGLHDTVDYANSPTTWGRWWGSNWVRSGLPGYSEGGGGDEQMCLAGLPDFKTESNTKVSVPTFLQDKWKKDGSYNTKIGKYGSSNTVTGYISSWLADWVETYGVDGFRCDTAKHVEKASWKQLKTKCVTALNNWRKNNPSKAGAGWDEDFWMTGECWGYQEGYGDYYSAGGFDSMISFKYSGSGVPDVGSINGAYQGAASQINRQANYNLLTYISSHDSNLARNNLMYQGSAFQLYPGGIQVYYGDESNRPLVSNLGFDGNGGSGHSLRSDMNFNVSGNDAAILAHWQKVGQFRNRHVAVGAGDHAQITAYNSSTGYAFSRSYDDGETSDGIIAVIGAPANKSIDVNVSSMWGNGTVVTNFYDGSKATVSGGKATFNSGANGTILIEGPQSTINMSIKGDYLFENSETVTVSLRGADTATVSIKGGTPFTVRNGDTFTIGEGIGLGEIFEVTMKATNATETLEKSFSFKKKDPYAVTTIYVDDSTTNWGNVKAYIYTGDGETAQSVAAWPGVPMKYDSTLKLYSYEVPDAFVNGRVIFSGDGGRYPADMEPGLEIKETNMILKNGSQWSEYLGPDPTPTQPIQPTNPVEPKRTILMGDVNGDKKVNVVDASEIQLHIVELKTLTGDALLACDTTGDGSVNVKDVTAVQYYAADDSEHESLCGKLVEVGTDTPTPTSPVEDPTQPTQAPDTTKHYIYCTSNWASVTAYYWSQANEHMIEWPGKQMESLGNKLFRIDVPADATKIIFSNNGQGQTGDLDIPGFNQCYDEGGSKTWSPHQGDNPEPTEPSETPGGKNYIYCTSNWDNVTAYYWSQANEHMIEWPGKQMESLGNKLFRIEVPADANKIIFSNNGQGQSADLDIPGFNQCFDEGGSKTWAPYNG